MTATITAETATKFYAILDLDRQLRGMDVNWQLTSTKPVGYDAAKARLMAAIDTLTEDEIPVWGPWMRAAKAAERGE